MNGDNTNNSTDDDDRKVCENQDEQNADKKNEEDGMENDDTNSKAVKDDTTRNFVHQSGYTPLHETAIMMTDVSFDAQNNDLNDNDGMTKKLCYFIIALLVKKVQCAFPIVFTGLLFLAA